MNENMNQNPYQNQGWNQTQGYRPGYPYGYGQPNPGYPQNDQGPGTFAIVSLVMGILSMLLCCVYGGFLGLAGLVFGIISIVKQEAKRGIAVAGIVTSALGILLLVTVSFFRLLIFERFSERFWEEFDAESIIQEYFEEYEENQDPIPESLPETDIESKQEIEGDPFAGKEYVAGDDSVIYFAQDGSFLWYQDDENHEDNYYQGTYIAYRGQQANDVLLYELTEYGVTEEELDAYFARNEGDDFYAKENFTVLILRTEHAIIGGSDAVEEPYERHYMGFFYEGDFDAANMDSGEYALFVER